jgi:hypothetical protein
VDLVFPETGLSRLLATSAVMGKDGRTIHKQRTPSELAACFCG